MSLVMLAIFAGMVTLAMTYPPEARLLPLVIGIPGTLLALIQVGLEVVDARRNAAGGPAPVAGDAPGGAPQAIVAAALADFEGLSPDVRREFTLLACLVGLAVAVLLFGFWLTIPAFMVLFLRFHEREEWGLTLALAIGGSAVLYLMFKQLLGILVFEGFLFGAVVG